MLEKRKANINVAYFKTKFIITLFFICLIVSIGQTSDSIKLKAGYGIDNITLFTSSFSKVKKYKGLIYEIKKQTFKGDGKNGKILFTREKTIVNSSKGIYFEFSSKYRKTKFLLKSKLSLIRITNNQNAFLENGIRIKHSRKSEIIDKYGIPKDLGSKNYLLYNSQGISFVFDINMVLIEVAIFLPNYFAE